MPSKRKSAINKNRQSFIQYQNRLKELAISMFEWRNLPDTIDERFLELALYHKGYAVFFYEDGIGYLALECAIGGKINVYRVPMTRKAYAANGFHRTLSDKDSVLIYNNMIRTNSVLDIEVFSRKLADLDRTIEINAKSQKTPIMIQCPEGQRITMMNLYEQYEGNEPFIFGAKNLDTGSIKVFQTGAPYVADRLTELKTEIWNEALTYLGISNINYTKKERMITDEVLRNQGGTIASRFSRLNARKQACDQINKMFGLNIDVVFREDYGTLTGEKGDEVSGSLHDGT